MPFFRYQAIDPAGKTVQGVFQADSLQEVEEWLGTNGLTPIAIQATAAPADEEPRLSLRDRLFGVPLEDRILFCRQIATMLTAGVPILQTLRVMGRQVHHPLLRQAIRDLVGQVESGAALSDAFSRHPKIFNPLFIHLVRVGEETGTLDRSFDYLAGLLENEKEIRERIKAATRYPKMVITALTGAIIFLMTMVVPKFVRLFASAHVTLPLPTRILVAVSNFVSGHFLVLLVLIAALAGAYRLALRDPGFVLARDRWFLRLPLAGSLALKVYLSRFCRVFAVLTRSGIDIIRTLELAAAALDNHYLRQWMRTIQAEVEQGVSLSEAMARQRLIPPLVQEMVTVGEQSGRLDEMMIKVADYYDAETRYALKNLATIIEPVLIVCLGALVGLIALAIFTPMWDMMKVARGG